MTIKAVFTDLEWYDKKRDQIFGDMGFAFCDRGDTIQPIENKKECLESTYDYINSEDCDDYDNDNSVAIYSVVEADVVFDDDEAEDYGTIEEFESYCKNHLSLGTIDFDTFNRVALFICTEDGELAGKIADKYDGAMFMDVHYGDLRGE